MAFDHNYYSHGFKTLPNSLRDTENYNNSNGCLDCNICLDLANEPVVTLCGHLYCWPCIYKWLHVQSASLAYNQQPLCPVCKAEISHTAMVPLYGRGHSNSNREEKAASSCRDICVPPRPPASGPLSLLAMSQNAQQRLPYRNPYRGQHFSLAQEDDNASQMLNLGTSVSPAFFPDHMVGMFGEMFYTRVFGNSESLYGYPNSYYTVGSISPRLRRQEMQADKSLNRISIFLLCCFILCLIVF
ncbi:hypothetical protein PIB30_041003 [Stylosanthes scabra]|uniref:E3 ubiquitin-protein ligase RMA n=1 Tax=Stylosanthes scabra TaxID=79078 RepID=A0ABU6XF33_9FABA|nr:hypothetical protein [Stylosanthes scabra]